MFVESFRPGTLEKMGLAPEVLLARNPKLVDRAHLRLGPGRALPAASRFRHAGRGHVGFRLDQRLRRPRAGAAADVPRRHVSRASTARRRVMIALREVGSERRPGPGDRPAAARSAVRTCSGRRRRTTGSPGKVKPRTGSRSTNAGPRNVYRSKDGHYVCLSASTQKMAERLFRSIGRAGPHRRSALPHQRRAREARRGARRRSSATSSRSARRPRTSRSSRRPRSPSARSTTSRRSSRTRTFIERELIADYPDPDMGAVPDAPRGAAAVGHARARSARRRRSWASTTARLLEIPWRGRPATIKELLKEEGIVARVKA